ncbi:hypothetical protein [Lutispora sp.]|uniref:hypothetical protein n=1 Tax=Lutispora sp. TaxID=2828727 RepID=UPI003563C476
MYMIKIIPYALVIIGLIINLIAGLYFNSNFIVLMLKSIVLTISLTTCGILISDTLKRNYMINVNKQMNEKKQSYNFEAYIPPITDEEFASLNKEDDFQEINPADLYNKK